MRYRGGSAYRNRHSGALRSGEGLLILVCVAAGRAHRRTRAPPQWSATDTFLGPRFGEPIPRVCAARSGAGSNRYQELPSDFYFRLQVRQADPLELVLAIGDGLHCVEGVPVLLQCGASLRSSAATTQYHIGPPEGAQAIEPACVGKAQYPDQRRLGGYCCCRVWLGPEIPQRGGTNFLYHSRPHV